MLKMPNIWLQWLQNIQKTPSWAFSALDLAKKLKKIGFLEVPLQTCCLWIAKLHLCVSNLAPAHFFVLKPSTGHIIEKPRATVERLGNLAP